MVSLLLDSKEVVFSLLLVSAGSIQKNLHT